MADDFKAEVEFAKVNVDENTVSWLCLSIDSALKAYDYDHNLQMSRS